jgi:hypothetical protein
MHRIDTDGHVNNLFTDGNPQTGQASTLVDSAWLNAIQENIIGALAAANIPLVKGNNGQLAAAIIALIAGVVGTGGGSVPTTRQLVTTGLLTGGSSLVSDVNLDVAKSTAAMVMAGVNDATAITPLAMATAFGGSLSSGYFVMPGGLILQWGTVIGSYAEGSVLATLPTAFTNTGYALTITSINQSGDFNRDVFAQRVSKSLGSFTAYLNYDGSGSAASDGFEFIAIGR